MTFAKIMKSVLVCATVLSVAACGMPSGNVNQMGAETDMAYERAGGALGAFRDAASRRGGGAHISEGVFVAPVKERNNASALLPARVQTPNAVVLVSRDALSLQQIADRLTTITGIEHIAALGPPAGMVPAEGGLKVVRPNYSGKLSEVLAGISSSFGVEWTYNEGKIIFRDYVTRQYQIPVIPSVASGGSTVGQSSSGYTADFWTEFEQSVDGILGSDVIYNISRTTGLLTVTAKVDSHAEIKAFVDEISKNMAQQIAFDVNVISVTLDKSKGMGLDIDLAVSDIGNLAKGDIEYNAPSGLSDTTSGMNLSIVEGAVSVDAIIESLAKQGKVSIETRTAVTTVNNRPVPIEVVDMVSYIAAIETERDEDTGNTRYVPQPQTQNIGYTLQLYPRIMNSNDIMVEYSLTLSELQSLKTFGTGENQVQLPEVSNTNFSQQTVLQNGHTLILSGFERTRRSFNQRSGASAGGIFGIGGSKRAEEERVATVVMIRPRILATNRSIRSGRN